MSGDTGYDLPGGSPPPGQTDTPAQGEERKLMDSARFTKVVEERLAKTRGTLISKADEYARGDRLSNFKDMAVMLHTIPEQALAGLVSKHIVALLDFIRDIEKGKVQSYPRWDEKIGDIMAYLCLLDAMVQERKQQSPNIMDASKLPGNFIPTFAKPSGIIGMWEEGVSEP